MTAGNSRYISGFLRQAWQASSWYSVNGVNCIACSLVCFPECINTFGFKGNIEVNICAAIKYHCGTREILHTLALAIWGLEVFSFFGLIVPQNRGLLSDNFWTKSICVAGLTLLSSMHSPGGLLGLFVQIAAQPLDRCPWWSWAPCPLAVSIPSSSQELTSWHWQVLIQDFFCRGRITDSLSEQSLWEHWPQLGASL